MAKAYRWLGAMSGKGMLHIRRADGHVRVVPPQNIEEGIVKASIISDPAELEALGDERIAELVAAGQLEEITLVDGIFNLLKREPQAFNSETGAGSLSMVDLEGAQKIVQGTADYEAEYEKIYAIPLKDEHGNIVKRDDLRGLRGGTLPGALPVTKKAAQPAYGGAGGTGASPAKGA